MKRYIKYLLLLLLIIPLNIFALSKTYEDKVFDIVGVIPEDDKINIYFFHKDGCPHCALEEDWLEEIIKEYSQDINIYDYELSISNQNYDYFEKVCKLFDKIPNQVPFTVIGDKSFSGFSDVTKSKIEKQIEDYLSKEEPKEKDTIKIPLIGEVNIKEVSLPLVAIVLGFLDGFNPCAMWILIFLINMLFNMKDKKKMWLLGLTFLFVSALVYFLSMLGLNFFLSIKAVQSLKVLIAIFIILAGLFNLRKYFITKNEDTGCHVVDDKKRKTIIKKMNKALQSKSFILSILGIAILAASVNLIELACTFGFPVVFSEILSINNVTGVARILYLLLYILFYIADDLIVFVISVLTLEVTGITNKYSKLCILISGIIMVIIGLLLIIKPEWLTFKL